MVWVKSSSRPKSQRSRRIYELEVCIIDGPVTKAFVEDNPVISRTIQIRGDQMLSTLHEAIFDAFKRSDTHMYEFQVGGKMPHDPKARKYVMPEATGGPFGDDDVAGLVNKATLDSLELKPGDIFGYWFDFGDDWWHRIKVLAIREVEAGKRYPRVVAKVGSSPPQYPDWDEEDEDDDDEEE
jgi:hypothetical protein